MAITSRRTNLSVSHKGDTPKTSLIFTVDAGEGLQESHVEVGFAGSAELVINGDFPTVTTGWTAVNSTLSIDTARLKIVNVGANSGYAHQAVNTVIGETYRITAAVTIGNATNAKIFVGTSIGNNSLGTATITTTAAFTFVATGVLTYIHLQNGDAVASDFNFYDNVTVRKSNDGTLILGRATNGIKDDQRIIPQAVNTRSNVASI